MHPEAQEELSVRAKKTVLDIDAHVGVTKTCHELDVNKFREEWANQGVTFILFWS